MTRQSGKPLTLATLGSLQDNMFGRAVDEGLRQCFVDCDDRPGLNKARRVTVTVDVYPDEEASGMSGSAQVVVANTKVTLPPAKTRKERLTMRRDADTGQPTLIVPDDHPALDLTQERDQ